MRFACESQRGKRRMNWTLMSCMWRRSGFYSWCRWRRHRWDPIQAELFVYSKASLIQIFPPQANYSTPVLDIHRLGSRSSLRSTNPNKASVRITAAIHETEGGAKNGSSASQRPTHRLPLSLSLSHWVQKNREGWNHWSNTS